MRRNILLLVLGIMLIANRAFAVPTSTLTITPSATAGTTITASDENTRNNTTQDWINAHDHDDINATGTVATGTWAATAVGTQYGGTGQVLNVITRGSILTFGGTGSGVMAAIAPPASAGTSGLFLKTSGSGADLQYATPGDYAVGIFTRDLDASPTGVQSITGVGFRPRKVQLMATHDANASIAAWGFATAAGSEVVMYRIHSGGMDVTPNILLYFNQDGTNISRANLASFDADGFSLTWSGGGGTPSGNAFVRYVATD